MSNSENLLLSEKDLNSMESFIKFAVRRAPITNPLQDRQFIVHQDSASTLICKTESKNRKRSEEDGSGEEEKENVCGVGAAKPPLKVKLPERKVYDDENDDGFKTPTSLDQKIPAVPECPPPPPRKPKAVPSMKRRAPRRRVLLDLTNEIELLFPPAVLADLGNKNIKKIRQ